MISGVGIVDKSIVRPVLDAINAIRSSPRDLAVYYGIIDQFSALWLGKPRSDMSLEAEDTIYLSHELLREYLRFEENNRRVALWLLTINRCCRNYTADLTEVKRRFERIVRGVDLSFDRTLLSPILEKVGRLESRHSTAVSKELGAGDIMGTFYQWIGIYCTYVYPRLLENTQARDAEMVSTIALLISEFISLKDHVSRMAALLLGIKEACAIGQPSSGTAGMSKAMEGEVAPGTESEYVEQILEKLGAESGAAGRSPGAPVGFRGPLKAEVLAAAERLEHAEAGEFARIMAEIERWGGEYAREGEVFRKEVEALLSRETRRSREATRRITSGLKEQPDTVRRRLEARLRSSSPSGRNLLARLIVLALLDISLTGTPDS